MACLLDYLDSLSVLANNQTWCSFRQKIEQPDYQKKIILIAVCVALFLDNMLYMVIVPIIPDYLRQIGAWSTHKEGGRFEFKDLRTIQVTSTQSVPESLTNLNLTLANNLISKNNSLEHLKKNEDNLEETNEEDYYYKNDNNKEDDENSYRLELKKRSFESTNKTHFHKIATRIGGHLIYEGEDSAIGVLFASKAIVQLVVNPFSGALIDRLGYDRPMMFGLSVLFFSTTIFACGKSYEILFFARSLQGVGSAFADTGGFAMIADRFTEPEQREKALGIALSFVSFGCLFAPPFGGFLYEFFGKQLPFIVLSLICLIDGFLVILVMAPAKKKSKIRLSSISNSNCHLESPTVNSSQSTPIYVLFQDKFIAVCAGALIMANISLACIEPTISIWMQDTMKAEEWQLGMVWLPSFFPYVFGVYFTVSFNKKYSDSQYLLAIGGLTLTGLSCFFIPLATNYYQLFLPIAVLCFGVALIDTAVFPLLAYIVDSRYVSVYGSVYAIADISYSVAYAFGPILGGSIMESLGFFWLNIIIAMSVFLYCPVLLSLKHVKDYNVIQENRIDSVEKNLNNNSLNDSFNKFSSSQTINNDKKNDLNSDRVKMMIIK